MLLEQLDLLLCPGRGTEYCDQLVCLSLCEHISGTAGPIFTNFLYRSPVAVGQSSSGSVAIFYVLPCFMDDVMFDRSGPYAWKAEPVTHYY